MRTGGQTFGRRMVIGLWQNETAREPDYREMEEQTAESPSNSTFQRWRRATINS